MDKDSDFFHVAGDINLSIGGFSGEASPLKTFGELIESMREHGMNRAADQLHDGLIKGGATEDWIQNAQMRFTPGGSPSIGNEVDDFDFHMFPRE
jgi:hypothetical protein